MGSILSLQIAPDVGLSSGACKPEASAPTWPPHAWAHRTAQVTGRERVVASWPGCHPGGPTVPCWRAGPFAGRALPSLAMGTWNVGRTGHLPPPARSSGPPDQRRASTAAVTSCDCSVGCGRLSGCGGIVCGSLASAGRSRGGDIVLGGGGGNDHCGDGGWRKRSSKWAGLSPLLQGPGGSGCGHLGPWLRRDLWRNCHKPARFHLGEARVHEGRAIVRRGQVWEHWGLGF